MERKINYSDASAISFILLISAWFFLPLIMWILLLGLCCFIFNFGKLTSIPLTILIVSLSFTIAGRYVGYLWGGSDDMPSYFLAYLNYDKLKWILSSSLKYARHADIGFSLYSWLIAQLTDHHLFIYYFTTVTLTYVLTLKFLKLAQTPYLLLSFLFIILFFKYFQFQWHLIRALMSIPIILIGLLLISKSKIKGLGIVFLGGLTHFSTFALSLPLIVFHKKLDKVWGKSGLFLMFISLVFGVVSLLISAKFLAAFSNYYVVSKIVSRLSIEPSFSMAPFLAFFMLITILTYPMYKISDDKTYIRIYNISFYYNVVGIIAIFIAGKELYRFIMPLFLLYSPLLFKSIQYVKQRFVVKVALLGLFFIHTLCIAYVLQLNESNFYYYNNEQQPLTLNGTRLLLLFSEYLEKDIEFYSGYRQ